jgi:CPA1 family monovalent cation:H+ antiporter
LAITERLRVPRRIITVLDGESLVNDATSLVAYRFAVAAVVTGAFSIRAATLKFFVVGIGGILVGLLVGWIAAGIQRRLDDPPVQITFSLLTPFAAYLLAERFTVSGVLAVVIAGLYLGWRSPEIINSRMRLQAQPVWEMVQFILTGLVFILIGFQLPEVLRTLSDQSFLRLAWYAALISLAVIVVRIIWVFPASYLPRFLSKKIRAKDPYPPWQHIAIVGWSGMRGVDSLAAALAIPLTVQNGASFPGYGPSLLSCKAVSRKR